MNEETNEMDDTQTAEVTAVREVVLNAYPDCVPELLQGETVQALLDSIEPARAAYARVAATVTDQVEPVAVSATPSTPPVVPAGGGRAVVDPGELPAAEKVRRGIAGRTR